jgi:hypothetical protein
MCFCFYARQEVVVPSVHVRPDNQYKTGTGFSAAIEGMYTLKIISVFVEEDACLNLVTSPPNALALDTISRAIFFVALATSQHRRGLLATPASWRIIARP